MSSIAGKKSAPELKELPPREFYSKPERRSFSLPRHINRENAIKYKRQKLSSPVKARSPESTSDDHEMAENSEQQQQISERERRYQKRMGGAIGGRTFLEPSLPPLRRSASFRNVRKLFGQLFKPPKHSDPHLLQNGYIPRDSASQGSLSNYDTESPRNSPSRFSRLFEGRPVAVTGMYNHGNTCYINSVIQCLAATDLLSEYFITDR